MANVIEEAKSGRASCRTCKQIIAKGELRLGVEVKNQFSDTPGTAWHHLLCAAGKLPGELGEAMATYEGAIANKAEIETAIAAALKQGKGKPGGFPYVDRAPTGRAKCMECEAPIGKDTFRVAVEREIDTGSMVTRGAGYMHAACAVANLATTGGSKDELLEGIRSNSRLAPEDLETAVGEIQAGKA